MRKRVFGALLALCLLLGLLPAGALRLASSREAGGRGAAPVLLSGAGRSDPKPPEAVYGIDKDSAAEKVYGIKQDSAVYNITEEAAYQTAAGGDWIEGALADACANVYPGGTVIVLRDIDPSSPVDIRKPLTLTSVDPQKPRKIVYTNKDQHDPFSITTYADVIMEHIILDGGREDGRTTHSELVGVRGGTLTLGDGAILQNNNNVDTAKGAGGLRIMNSGQAVMQAGSVIRNCRAVAGGGAAVANRNAKLVLNGGTIEDCEAFIGGGVYIQAMGWLELYDGSTIRRNAAKEELEGMSYGFSFPEGNGGGICVELGYLMLKGAESGALITENTAESTGGGIYINVAFAQLANGSVTNNYAAFYGGGLTISAESASTTVILGMNPNISGNRNGKEHFEDVYLDGMDEVYPAYSTRPMSIGAPLTDKASIGVSRWTKPDDTHKYRVVAKPYGSYIITTSDLNQFFSDDPKYVTLLHEEAGSPDNGTIVITNADVAFDNQNHGKRPPSQLIDSEHKVQEPDPLVERGYTFEGWYREPECATEWTFDEDTVDIDVKPQVLYAKWELNHYLIEYDVGEDVIDDTGNPTDYTITSGKITLKAPTREGYRFLGWKQIELDEDRVAGTSPVCSARSVTSETASPDAPYITSIPANSIGYRKLQADWEKLPTCTVTYRDGTEGEVFEDKEFHDLLTGDATPAFDSTPEREGYIFKGWDPEVAETVTGDTVYTARWQELPKYTVTYKDGADGAAFADQVTENVYEGTATPPFDGAPEREGYTFQGWDPEVAETVTGDAVYTARWNELPKYTVTYKDGAGGAAFADQVTENVYEGTATPPFDGTPQREGYTFKSWLPEVAETVTGNAVYTARWEENAAPKPPDPPGPSGGDDDGGDPPGTPDLDPGTDPAPDPGADPPPDPGTDPTQDPGADPIPGPGEELPPDPGTKPDPEPEPEPVPAPRPDPIPQTGDPTHTALWAGCALASLAGILLVLRPQRRRR